jgi:uncharacterized protein YndB with AHSA1/START domain
MREYRFLTTWCLEAPRESVWDAIWESERWPEWWRGVVAAQMLVRGEESGVGQVSRFRWRSKLPYNLDFQMTATRVERPRLLEGRAEGELAGVGRWRLFEEEPVAGDAPVTAVLYEWNVSTTRRWMNVLAPVARPVFEWNHDWVMRNGGEGMARRLGCRLIAVG